MQLLKLASLVLILAISGCETIKYVPQTVRIPILPLPTLPKLTPEQEQSIPEDVYLILVERDETWKQHVLKINKILKTHNGFK